jgi:hypothetical protein
VLVEAPPVAATIGTARPSMTRYLTGMLGDGLRGTIVPDTALLGAVFAPHGKTLLVLQSRASLLLKLLPRVVGESNCQPLDVRVALRYRNSSGFPTPEVTKRVPRSP